MSTPDFDTLIIGAGFAGLSVAHSLGGTGLAVIDRGEPLDLGGATSAYDKALNTMPARLPPEHLTPGIDLETRLLASRQAGNSVHLPLSTMSANVMSYVQGGISNWWGGYAARLTRATFEQDGVLQWPIGYDDVATFYRQAEGLLRVHGDPRSEGHGYCGELPGWDYWRDYFQPLFPRARVTPQAKNVSDRDAGAQGLCQGNGHCALCPNDAKARPATVFPQIDVIGNSRVDRIVFDGNRAVAVQGTADGEDFEVGFRRLVVASGGIENVALLRRSALPDGVPQHLGHHYQDHTTCEILGVMPQAFDRFRLGAEGGVEIPELSGTFEGIELKTVMLPVQLTDLQAASLAAGNPAGVLADLPRRLQRTAVFYLQMEVPPEWNLHLRSRGLEGYVHTTPYLRHVPLLDAVVLQVARRMAEAGIQVAAALPHHRERFGGHHYSGTTPMSATDRRVVDSDLRLVGTDNVWVNGGSVIPRCGGAGPTLTIAALGLRLGAHLAARRS